MANKKNYVCKAKTLVGLVMRKLKGTVYAILANRKIAGDLGYTVGASVLMNVVLHIVIYPLTVRFFGNEALGEILYFLGIIYIIPAALGTSLGTTRLVVRKTHNATNGDYNELLRLFCAVSAIICGAISFFDLRNPVFSILYALFSVVFALRIYAQVEFRLKLHFSGFFCYNGIVCTGYLVGFGLYFFTGQWLLIFLLGEILALLHSFFRGSIFKKECKSGARSEIINTFAMLALSVFIREGVFQLDKVIIRQFVDVSAVTEYHVVTIIARTIQLLIGPMQMLILSYLTVDNSKLDRRDFTKLVAFGLGFCAFFYAVCIIATPVYIKVFYGEIYNQVIKYNSVAHLGLIFGFVSHLYTGILISQGRTKLYTTVRAIWGVIYLCLSCFLTLRYAIWGMIISTLAASVINLILVLLVTYKVLYGFADKEK